MGCGCSNVVRQVNPSESPGSTRRHSWLKPNGTVSSVDDTLWFAGTALDTIDVRSQHSSSDQPATGTGPPTLTATVGVQCELIAPLDTGHRSGVEERYRVLRTGSSLALATGFDPKPIEDLQALRAISSECLSGSDESLPGPRSEVTDSNRSFVDFLAQSCGLSSVTSIRSADVVTQAPAAILAAKSDASIQTDRQTADPDNVPELAPRPPPCLKAQLVGNCRFGHLDQRALQVPDIARRSVRSLVGYLTGAATCDMDRVRLFYFWICHNIRYNVRYADLQMTPGDVLESRIGVCRDYARLFSEMCRLSDIRVRELSGFAKGFDYRAGHNFRPGHDAPGHTWNAVFLNASWRFIDCTWGTGFVNSLGQFQDRFSEHFFLTDPDVFAWTHFPWGNSDETCSRWQLLEQPLSLAEFNVRPKVYPHFFEYRVRIRSAEALKCPLVFAYSTEILLSAPQVLHYKYKLYPADGVEGHQLDRYVFCQLKEERLLGSFTVTPPDDGHYLLKVYARPDCVGRESALVLDCIVVFVLECTKAWKNVARMPPNDQPWGPTGYLAEFGLRFLNVTTPVLVVVTGRRTLLLETSRAMLISQQLTDADGNPIGQKNVIHRTRAKDNSDVVRFVVQPPDVGLFKLTIYACPDPNDRGRYPLPRVATFLVDCKQTSWTAGEIREQIFLKKPKKV